MFTHCSIHTTWYNEHLLPHDEDKNNVLSKIGKEVPDGQFWEYKFPKQNKKKKISALK
jgi:hypothetical protein